MLFFRAHLKACVHLVHFGLKNNVYTYILYWETVLMNTFCSRFLLKTLLQLYSQRHPRLPLFGDDGNAKGDATLLLEHASSSVRSYT